MKPPTYFQRAAGMRAPMRYLTPLHPFSRAARANESEGIAETARPAHAFAEEAAEAEPARETLARPAAARAARLDPVHRAAIADAPQQRIEALPESKETARREAAPLAPEPAVRPAPLRTTAQRDITVTTSAGTKAANAPVASRIPATRDAESHAAVPRIATPPAIAAADEIPQEASVATTTTRIERTTSVVATTARETTSHEMASRETTSRREPPLDAARIAPVVAQPLPSSSPAPSPPPQTVDRGVHIGTIEVRVMPPPVEAALAPAPATPSAPLSRGFASPIGLRQS